MWKGEYCNPFFDADDESNAEKVAKHFTDEFTIDEFIPLDFSLLQCGKQVSSSTRGNIPLAFPSIKPQSLRKVEFLDFTKLRAYPFQQVRRLCVALIDGSLPLRDASCHILLRQTLYHLGEFSSESKLLWRRDITDGEWLPLLEKEVAFALERLRNTTRETNSLHIVGEIASYISQWLPNDSQCSARRAAEIAQKFGNDLSPIIEDMKVNTVSEGSHDTTVNSDRLAQLCTKQAIYYLIGLCCYADVQFTYDDIVKLCELRVQANQVHAITVPISSTQDLKALIDTKAKLLAIVENMMTLRINDTISLIDKDNSCLTNALKRCVDGLPEHLNWTALEYSSYCFEASHSGTIYDINVMSGCILINGSPPNVLPTTILQHPMYKRTLEITTLKFHSALKDTIAQLAALWGRYISSLLLRLQSS